MARKQSATIWFDGQAHKEIYFNGHYHDKMYKCDSNGNCQLVWEKLSSGLTQLTGVSFVTVVKNRTEQYALIRYMNPTALTYYYGVATDKSGTWVMITELGLYATTKWSLYATGKGFVVCKFSGQGSVYNSTFNGWYYGLTEEIEENKVELQPLEELTDGSVLFKDFDEVVICQPSVYAYKGSKVSTGISAKNMTCYLTRDAVFRLEDHQISATITKQYCHEFTWSGVRVSDENMNEYPPLQERISTARNVQGQNGFLWTDSSTLTYTGPERQETTLTKSSFALMVGADRHNVGEDCTEISAIIAHSGGDRSSSDTSKGGTLQMRQYACMGKESGSKLFIMAAAWDENSTTENYYYRRRNIALYGMGSWSRMGAIKNVSTGVQGIFNPSRSELNYCYGVDVYGLFFTQDENAITVIYDEDDDEVRLFVGKHDDDYAQFMFIDKGKVAYPYSVGGVLETEDGNYICMSKSTNNYHSIKSLYNVNTGDLVTIPVFAQI